MSLPDSSISDAQALKHPAQSSTQPPPNVDSPTGAQLEPQNAVKSAECEYFPAAEQWAFIVRFLNWDPEKDGKADLFEEILRVKFGDDVYDFRGKNFPPDTQFFFHVPYPGGERFNVYPNMCELVSEAIFEYSGKAGIRTECWHV